MKYDIEKIRQLARQNPDTAILYFWGHTPNPKKMTTACFSQWYDCYFEINGVQYHTTEQYMMASKARLFVVEGNKAKFSQNPDIKEFLLSTRDAIIAEASPYDNIWGIGLDREQALKGTVEQWKGENLLGCVLMDVRDWLRDSSTN